MLYQMMCEGEPCKCLEVQMDHPNASPLDNLRAHVLPAYAELPDVLLQLVDVRVDLLAGARFDHQRADIAALLQKPVDECLTEGGRGRERECYLNAFDII